MVMSCSNSLSEVRKTSGAPPRGVRARRGQEVHPGGRQRGPAAKGGREGRRVFVQRRRIQGREGGELLAGSGYSR